MSQGGPCRRNCDKKKRNKKKAERGGGGNLTVPNPNKLERERHRTNGSKRRHSGGKKNDGWSRTT
eukprot:NODE_4758_length_555_cov_25.185771_g3460_i1.p4 GENE.NODE_4758_length_555_cov_25.185771_g3460_i1~~NODE_4758_length_555_cov_25.185771_g3460_i1.p4  ORF type:complete len:65 (-),score=4.90 NODE_4758_length_555_cov_25.185771_g3460_i1:237-431(-)